MSRIKDEYGYEFANRMMARQDDRLLQELLATLTEHQRGTIRDRIADAYRIGRDLSKPIKAASESDR